MVPILIQTIRLLRALRPNWKQRRRGTICCRAFQATIPKWYLANSQKVQKSRGEAFKILLKLLIKHISHRAVSDGYSHPIRSHQRIILEVEGLLAKKENIAKVNLKR